MHAHGASGRDGRSKRVKDQIPSEPWAEAANVAIVAGVKVMVRLLGGAVIGWSSTHERLSAFPVPLLAAGRGTVPPTSLDVQVQAEELSPESVAELCNV